MSSEPARWLVEHAHLLPLVGDALDVACGRGRHAMWLAQRGLRTLGVDRDAAALDALRNESVARGLEIRTAFLDLETGEWVLGRERYDVIVVVRYLYRPLFPRLRDALRAGGVLVYETFIKAQAARGKPTNPEFLLDPGELRELVEPLEVLVEREGEFEGTMLSSVIARRR
jgi:SAM-dependent methyltransferase